MSDILYEVEKLNVTFPGRGGETRAVRDASFTLGHERLAIVGESGSGKSTLGRALLGILPPTAKVSAEKLSFDGMDLRQSYEWRWQALRGTRISMVMQDPKYSLNPVKTVGWQIEEAYRLHKKCTSSEAKARAMQMLNEVQIRNPDLVYQQYPHQLSGGMGQRVMIAAMLIAEPDLLIADEPTSALDVTVQNQVLRIMDRLVRERGMGLIFISHNLTVVSSFCDRVLVMYGGRIVEECKASELHKAKHPYTQALVRSAPVLGETGQKLAIVKRDPAWLS
ncbi:ABC transporter ATP-binding protein [Aestuariivirga litoralis]|uniref:ABC transporter ATP-binding protein n=1 Tax=Aestuariivirga litoralis TaxID=2650924 RepID=UPI0018C5211D|nr:ABC transporter ATP-binding protein [Aestuariivirga litoralis]MBG1231762.1 ABC transporter ATP-binding protein [Aestuariivirga litoralis]